MCMVSVCLRATESPVPSLHNKKLLAAVFNSPRLPGLIPALSRLLQGRGYGRSRG